MEKDELKLGVNTGFVAVDPQPGDFVAGSETGILDAPVNAACDWRAFLPTNVTQLMKKSNGLVIGDTNACVSFAGKQSVETQLIQQMKLGVISADNLAWLKANGYLDASGKPLLSARFTAVMSGTDPNVGNSLPRVWSSLKNDGAVPEALWPMPNFDACNSTQEGWNVYYKPIAPTLQGLGKEFAQRFPVLYEWLVYPGAPAAGQELKSYLSVSPLEIATAVCAGWNTDDPIQACGAGGQHATLLTFVEEPSGLYDILDHYNPFQKQFSATYSITYGMRGVVGQAIAPPPAAFHYVFTKQLTYLGTANDPGELRALQQALQYLKGSAGAPYMKPGVFGPFGPQTRAALALFQADHGIADSGGQGVDFGPQSRLAMNPLVA